MAYDAQNQMPSAPTGEPQTPAEPPMEQESPAEDTGESFFIPKDIVEGKTFKAGDKITLEVIGTDQDGDLEVKMPGEGGDWKSELRDNLSQNDNGGANG